MTLNEMRAFLEVHPKTSIMGMGFIGSRYHQLYPDETTPEPRDTVLPTEANVLFTRSTTSNYAPTRGDLHVDIDTNLTHLMDVLPYVKGEFSFLSSWFCYGRTAGVNSLYPACESDPCDPNGFYGITKLAAEKLTRSYCQMQGSPYRILRLCNVIGNDPRASKTKNALEMMLAKVARGEDVELYTGDAYRAVMHVDDVCRAIHLCLSTDKTLDSITNIGPTSSTRMFDLLQHALHVTGSKSRVTLVAPPRFHQLVQVDSFHMCTTKLRGFGFVPEMDAYQAVERVIANMTR